MSRRSLGSEFLLHKRRTRISIFRTESAVDGCVFTCTDVQKYICQGGFCKGWFGSECLQTPSKRTENALKTPSKRLQNAFKTPSKRIENAFKTPSKRLQNAFKTPSKRLRNAFEAPSKRLENALKTPSKAPGVLEVNQGLKTCTPQGVAGTLLSHAVVVRH